MSLKLGLSFVGALPLLCLLSCTPRPIKSLAQNTGLKLCQAANIRATDSGTHDVDQFEILLPNKHCVDSLYSSVAKAGDRKCSEMLVSQRGCSYSFAGNTVMIRMTSSPYSHSQAVVVRSW